MKRNLILSAIAMAEVVAFAALVKGVADKNTKFMVFSAICMVLVIVAGVNEVE